MTTKRFPALDALRGLAIILMIITHGFRLYTNHYPLTPPLDVGFQLLNFFALIEPFTSALFLTLVGVSLSFNLPLTSSGLKKLLTKAGVLYLLGLGLFLIEYGYQPRDLWWSPSILSTIAAALLIHGCWLRFLGTRSLFILLLGILYLTYHYEGLGISGINGGPGGIFPLISFTTFGLLLGQGLKIRGKLTRWWIITAGLGGLAFFVHGPWINHYYSSYYVYGDSSNFFTWVISLFSGGSEIIRSYSFWNHSVLGAIRLWLPLTVSLVGFLQLRSQHLIYQKLQVLGTNALNCYILHLLLLALLDLGGFWPKNSLLTWILIGFVTTLTLRGARLLPKWL